MVLFVFTRGSILYTGEPITEFVSTISSKGQVTIPADVRRRLGVHAADKVAFVTTDQGTVELRPVRFTLESVLGSVPALPNETTDLDQEIDEAIEAATGRDRASS